MTASLYAINFPLYLFFAEVIYKILSFYYSLKYMQGSFKLRAQAQWVPKSNRNVEMVTAPVTSGRMGTKSFQIKIQFGKSSFQTNKHYMHQLICSFR